MCFSYAMSRDFWHHIIWHWGYQFHLFLFYERHDKKTWKTRLTFLLEYNRSLFLNRPKNTGRIQYVPEGVALFFLVMLKEIISPITQMRRFLDAGGSFFTSLRFILTIKLAYSPWFINSSYEITFEVWGGDSTTKMQYNWDSTEHIPIN